MIWRCYVNDGHERHNDLRHLDGKIRTVMARRVVSQHKLREILTASIQQLEPAQRTVFVLRDIEGLSTKETAAALEVSVSAVRSRLLRARLILKDILSSSFDPSAAKLRLAPVDKAIVETTVDFQKRLDEIAAENRNLFQLSSRQFEELVAEIFDRFGYSVELTKHTRDGGRDIIAVRQTEADIKLLIECKRYARENRVGVSLVRSLYGVKMDEKATKAILATTSTFTQGASEFVTRNRWELEGRDHDGVVEWVNQARNMTKRSTSGLWVPTWIDLTKSTT